MKIVLYGLAKSGTSAVFYQIRNSLPAGTICLFEPQAWSALDRLKGRLKATLAGRARPDVLVKLLPFERKSVRTEDFNRFDKAVLIVRDPRDRIISELLYRVFDASFVASDSAVRAFIELLRAKEASPSAIALRDLIETFEALDGGSDSFAGWATHYRARCVDRTMAFHDARPGLFVFRYEDLVDGRADALAAYLGFPLSGAARVGAELARVVRTKRYGDWRRWFTKEDVRLFKPLLQPYLDRYYPAADWTLEPAARLDPQHGSRYVERLVAERRGTLNPPPFKS